MFKGILRKGSTRENSEVAQQFNYSGVAQRAGLILVNLGKQSHLRFIAPLSAILGELERISRLRRSFAEPSSGVRQEKTSLAGQLGP